MQTKTTTKSYPSNTSVWIEGEGGRVEESEVDLAQN